MKIALVIGHSTIEQGARNDTYNITEFKFNRTLARLIKQLWGPDDLELVYRDGSFRELPVKINALEPQIILSLHCNAFNGLASGTETLYSQGSQKGEACAEAMQGHLVDALGLSDRGTKPRMAGERGGYLLRKTRAPCVIAEPFFIDNDSDYETAWDNLDKLVDAYVKGLKQMLWIR